MPNRFDHPNAQLARRLWDATAQADVETLFELFDPEVEWIAYGDNPTACHLRGIEAVLEYMGLTAERVDILSSDLIDIYANARGAVLYYRIVAQLGERRHEGEVLLKLDILAGRAVRVAVVPFDQAAGDAFWNAL